MKEENFCKGHCLGVETPELFMLGVQGHNRRNSVRMCREQFTLSKDLEYYLKTTVS